MKRRPAWLEVRKVTIPFGEYSEELDAGESEAIALARKYGPDVLLLIDRNGVALRRSVTPFVQPGFLECWMMPPCAASWIYAQPLGRLRTTNFRASDSLLEWFLARDRQRKQGR